MTPASPMTVEEYLEFERTSPTRHEFVDGVMVAMSGESKKHNRIAIRIVKALDDIAETKGCSVYVNSVKLRTRGSRYRYPDVIVTCEDGGDDHIVDAACVLFEVLSESTESVDVTEKLSEYTRIPSLQRYVLVSQHQRFVTVFKRVETRWEVEILEDSGEVEIPCLETGLSLDQIYGPQKT
jgi:Uma2 family endonuclease